MKTPSKENSKNLTSGGGGGGGSGGGGGGGSNGNKSNNNSLNNSQANLNAATANQFDHKTFIKILHGDNKTLVLNSLCSCLHLLNYLRDKLNINKDEQIDLIDFDGNIKEIPNVNNKEYAIQYLVPTTSYTVLRIDVDPITNERRYTALINESRLNANLIKALTNLNTGKNLSSRDKARITRETRQKQLQQTEQQKQQQHVNLNNSSSSSQSNTTGLNTSRKSSRQFK